MVRLKISAAMKDEAMPPFMKSIVGRVIVPIFVASQSAIGEANVFGPVDELNNAISDLPIWVDLQRRAV